MRSIVDVVRGGQHKKQASLGGLVGRGLLSGGLKGGLKQVGKYALPVAKGYAASEGVNNLYEASTGAPLSDGSRNALWLLGGGLGSKHLRKAVGLNRRLGKQIGTGVNQAATYGLVSDYVKGGITDRAGFNPFNESELQQAVESAKSSFNEGLEGTSFATQAATPPTKSAPTPPPAMPALQPPPPVQQEPLAWQPPSSNHSQLSDPEFASFARGRALDFLQRR